MDDAAAKAPETPVSLWKDFGYYTLWWCVVFGIGGALNPVTGPGLDQFWLTKVIQMSGGVAQGFIGAVLFTMAQNLWNIKRRKPVSWGLAIAIWMAVKFSVVAILHAF